jgi:hypothetical protein
LVGGAGDKRGSQGARPPGAKVTRVARARRRRRQDGPGDTAAALAEYFSSATTRKWRCEPAKSGGG